MTDRPLVGSDPDIESASALYARLVDVHRMAQDLHKTLISGDHTMYDVRERVLQIVKRTAPKEDA